MLIDRILELLRDEIGENEYNRYIKNIIYDQKNSKSNLALFIAPNPLLAKWIKTKYGKKIADIFELKTGIRPEIKVISKSFSHNSKNNISSEQNKTKKDNSSQISSILNPSYNFDSFVVGNSNIAAYNIAKSVSEKPGLQYNPFFIYGMSGLGKTHLLQAIGNEALKKDKIVIYSTSEEFMNDFRYNLKNQTMDRFRQKYRECDYLLIDDVQFFSNKKETQEEFFHTFNELHKENKQIVLTSDKHPKKIAGLEERLISRFAWGIVTDIQPPELETKINIIEKKCELNDIKLDKEIVDFIASNMGENIREIESAIITLNGYASVMRQEITLDFAKDVMKDHIRESRENITLEEIIKTISKELNVKPSDIKSKKRNKNIVEARRIGIYLARNLTPNSMPALAEYFGMKDHTAVSHNMKKINQLIEENENFKLKVEELKNKITAKK
jgi:chromosomal replication initiator protein